MIFGWIVVILIVSMFAFQGYMMHTSNLFEDVLLEESSIKPLDEYQATMPLECEVFYVE